MSPRPLLVGALTAALACAPLVAALPASASAGSPRAAGDRLDLALVATLTTPASADPVLDAESLAALTAEGGSLDAQLDALVGRPVAIGIDPRILVSIRLLGRAAPESALSWLARLAGASNETFLLGYGDADPAALGAAGAGDAVLPSGLDTLVDASLFGAETTATPTPLAEPSATPSPDPAGPPLPSDEDLLAWPEADLQLSWPLEGSVTSAGLDALVEAQGGTTLLASDQVDAGAVHVRLRHRELDALVVDETLSAPARELAATFTPIGSTARRDLVAALRSGSVTGDAAIITLGREQAAGPLDVDAVIAAVRASGSARLVDLTAITDTEAVAVRVDAPEADPSGRSSTLSRLAAEDRRFQRFASVASDPASIAVPSTLRVAVLGGAGWQLSPEAWETAVGETVAASAEQRRSVQLAPSSDLLVLSNSTGLPITVTNGLDVPVTVYVRARALRPLLRVDSQAVELVVEPDSQGRVYIPATAITNGSVPVEITVRSASGVLIGPSETVNVELQAQWETVGLVLGGVVILVFAGGIARNIVVRRRRARAERDTDESTTGADV